uniref:DRIM domain-containing protein n=1 Tax=Caenorhabditis tropicalis TaxID=1561998 RepID=A0A1I7TUW2_9PELO
MYHYVADMDEPNENELFAKYYAAKKQFKKVKKYLTFNERIAQMGGDNGRFSRKLTTETSFETYFQDAIDNWRGEDQGPDLEAFVMEIQVNEIKTYAQLLHKSDKIFEILCKHITLPGSKSVPALCGILSALARDLREKFNKHCWKSIEILVNILDLGEKIAENMEAAYLCFSILVKVQATFLSKQLKKSFINLLPLFASSRDFVRRFASEAFAYLLRKATDLRAISSFVARQAFKTPHMYLSDGCALLFYNTFVGIAGSFHSNCEQIFRDVMHSLVMAEGDSESSSGEFHEFCVKILIQVVGYTIEYAKSSKYENRFFYQTVLTKMLGESKNMKEVVSFMRLLQPCVVQKNDDLMNEITKKKKKREKDNKKNKGKNELKRSEKVEFVCVSELKASLDNVVRIEDFELEQHSVNFISEILLSIFDTDKNRLFSRDVTLKIVEKSTNFQAVIELLLRTINLESFDLYMMPALGKIATAVVKSSSPNDFLLKQVISFYSILCSQRRPIKETVSRSSRSNFFDLSSHYYFRDWLTSNFSAENRRKFGSETLIDMVVAWPWLYSQADAVKGSEDVLDILRETIKSPVKSVVNSQLVYACSVGLFLTNKSMLKSISKEDIETFLDRQKCCESALLTFEIFSSVDGESNDINHMNRVVDLLFPAVLNSDCQVRKTVFKILSNFKLPLPKMIDEEGNVRQQTKTVFEVLYDAEDSELTNFRERLLHLRKLRHGDHVEFIPLGSNKKVEMMILADIVSQFFVGFSPLWKGVFEVLATFANGMDIDTFWNVLSLWINHVNENINRSEDIKEDGRLIGVDIMNRSDFVNARIQLFTFFETIPDIAERRTRVLSPLVLNLFERYNKLTSSTFLSSSVTEKLENDKEFEQAAIEEGQDVVEEEDEEEVEGTVAISTENISQRQETTHTLKALTALLNVYSKFNAAKSVYMEAKLLEMYEQLLGSRYESIQKAALACILSYRNTILANYRENLEALIDEKTLRQTLTYFKLSDDEGDAQVVEEHRAVVVPILLRLLNGKLLVNNKQKGMVSRRNGIIYIIGGCRSNELTFFLRLFFEQIYKIFGQDASFVDIKTKCANVSFFDSLNLKVFQKFEDCVSAHTTLSKSCEL